MIRKDGADEYARALDVGLVASDRVQAEALRNDLVLERARLATRRRDARRLAAKYESKEVDARAEAAIRDQEHRVAAATEEVDRTFVERVEAPPDRAVVHGIARVAKASGLDVVALDDHDRQLGSARADPRGYWKLEIALGGVDVKQKLPIVGAAGDEAATRVRLVVRRGDRELHRDKDLFTVRAGRVQYRELALKGG